MQIKVYETFISLVELMAASMEVIKTEDPVEEELIRSGARGNQTVEPICLLRMGEISSEMKTSELFQENLTGENVGNVIECHKSPFCATGFQ